MLKRVLIVVAAIVVVLLIVISMLFLALGGLEAIASRRLSVANPLPNASVSATWYWK